MRVQRGAGIVVVVLRTGAGVDRVRMVGHHVRIFGGNGTGHDAAGAVVGLVVGQGCVAGHGVVAAQAGLALVDDDVEGDGGDVGGGADHGEGEEDLVDAADGDAGGGGPVGGVAGGGDGVCHAPAEEAEGDQPEDEEDGVADEGEARREPGGAVGDGCEDVVQEGEDGGDEERGGGQYG